MSKCIFNAEFSGAFRFFFQDVRFLSYQHEIRKCKFILIASDHIENELQSNQAEHERVT